MVFVESLESPRLDGRDRHHLERVLRRRRGDALVICDGRGRWCRAWLDAEPEPSGPVFVVARPAPSLAVGFALIKGDRPELVIQKLTELDIDVVAPFVARHSVVRWDDAKSARQVERHELVAREAAMQCRRTWLPTVEAVRPFGEVIAVALGAPAGAASDGERAVAIADMGGDPVDSEIRMVLVGPEGGWSDDERGCGARRVRLGANVLRAETAAITAGVILGMVHGR